MKQNHSIAILSVLVLGLGALYFTVKEAKAELKARLWIVKATIHDEAEGPYSGEVLTQAASNIALVLDGTAGRVLSSNVRPVPGKPDQQLVDIEFEFEGEKPNVSNYNTQDGPILYVTSVRKA